MKINTGSFVDIATDVPSKLLPCAAFYGPGEMIVVPGPTGESSSAATSSVVTPTTATGVSSGTFSFDAAKSSPSDVIKVEPRKITGVNTGGWGTTRWAIASSPMTNWSFVLEKDDVNNEKALLGAINPDTHTLGCHYDDGSKDSKYILFRCYNGQVYGCNPPSGYTTTKVNFRLLLSWFSQRL